MRNFYSFFTRRRIIYEVCLPDATREALVRRVLAFLGRLFAEKLTHVALDLLDVLFSHVQAPLLGGDDRLLGRGLREFVT